MREAELSDAIKQALISRLGKATEMTIADEYEAGANRNDLDDLISRLEKAEDGSYALDCEILKAIGYGAGTVLQGWTTIVEQALTLVPDDFSAALWSAKKKSRALLTRGDGLPLTNGEIDVIHKSAPIAICIAALKARKVI